MTDQWHDKWVLAEDKWVVRKNRRYPGGWTVWSPDRELTLVATHADAMKFVDLGLKLRAIRKALSPRLGEGGIG